jgi:hypothetical protein
VSRNFSLIGPKYVWMGNNPPKPDRGNILDVYGEAAAEDLQGFIQVTGDAPDPTADPVVEFWKSWVEKNRQMPNR